MLGAVDRVVRRSRRPTCMEIVRALRDGDATETRVGDAVLYDIVLADRIVRTRAPRFIGLM